MMLGQPISEPWLPGTLTAVDADPAQLLVEEGVHRLVALEAFEFDLQAEVVGTVRIDERLFEGDLILFVELKQDVIERLAAFLDPLFHGFLQRIDLGLLDPFVQRVGRAADLGRNGHDRSPMRGVLTRVLGTIPHVVWWKNADLVVREIGRAHV